MYVLLFSNVGNIDVVVLPGTLIDSESHVGFSDVVILVLGVGYLCDGESYNYFSIHVK